MYRPAACLPNRPVVIACLALILALLPLGAAYAEHTGPTADAPWGDVPMWFTPMPAIYETGPQFEAFGAAGHFTFDLTGYTFTALDPATGDRATVRMQFELGRGQALLPANRLTNAVNDSRGADASTARRSVPAYGRLIYQGLYPGIDLQYEGQPGRLKGLYIVAPGADPVNIQWRYDGAAAVEVRQPNGELWVRLPGARADAHYLISGAPIAWQEFGQRKVAVTAAYQVSADGRVSFELGEYDRARPLIIDSYLS